MEDNIRINHNVIIEDRKKFTLTGVRNVIAFDEETILLETSLGSLTIKGIGLKITNFDNESGDLSGEGKVCAFVYTADEKNGGFFSRIFK